MKALKAQVQNMEYIVEEVKSNKDKLAGLEKSIAHLCHKINDLEDRSRRNNLLIFGVSETDGETPTVLYEKIDKLFREVLEVDVKTIERLHRVGRRVSHKDRPVILKVYDYREKIDILRNCRKLKGTAFSVSEDFCDRTRDVRKKLWESAKDERNQGSSVRLVYNKLIVNGVTFEWDSSNACRRPITAKTSFSSGVTQSCNVETDKTISTEVVGRVTRSATGKNRTKNGPPSI